MANSNSNGAMFAHMGIRTSYGHGGSDVDSLPKRGPVEERVAVGAIKRWNARNWLSIEAYHAKMQTMDRSAKYGY